MRAVIAGVAFAASAYAHEERRIRALIDRADGFTGVQEALDVAGAHEEDPAYLGT